MANDGKPESGDIQPIAAVPSSFPDAATCRVQKAQADGTYECLSPWGSFCPHSVFVEFAQPVRFCNHPTKEDIYLRKG